MITSAVRFTKNFGSLMIPRHFHHFVDTYFSPTLIFLMSFISCLFVFDSLYTKHRTLYEYNGVHGFEWRLCAYPTTTDIISWDYVGNQSEMLGPNIKQASCLATMYYTNTQTKINVQTIFELSHLKKWITNLKCHNICSLRLFQLPNIEYHFQDSFKIDNI